MQIARPIDIEGQLQRDLTTVYAEARIDGVRFTAPPIPHELGEIPQQSVIATITRVGGERADLVIDINAVSIDVYGPTWEQATHEANRLAALIEALPYQNDTEIRYESTEITTLPYTLPDPSNPVNPRMRMLATIIVKAAVQAV